jgi:1-acyl-sn-glycerol-3-phosphate acyltransferase
MSRESRGYNPEEEQVGPKEFTPKRLMVAMQAWKKGATRDVQIYGRENLQELPRERKIVVATSHGTDLDIPLTVYALGKDLDLAIINESVHHDFFAEPPTNFGMRLAGKENFIPIDYKGRGAHKTPRAFNPENFAPMAEALEKGKRVVIAAHNPLHKGETEPKGPGYGAAYLAETSGAVILPVAVRKKSAEVSALYEDALKNLMRRPDMDVIIGAPFELPKIPGIEEMHVIMAKRAAGEKLEPQERQRFSDLTDQLKQQAQTVLDKVLALGQEGENK